jgi:hypothetical protein
LTCPALPRLHSTYIYSSLRVCYAGVKFRLSREMGLLLDRLHIAGIGKLANQVRSILDHSRTQAKQITEIIRVSIPSVEPQLV